MSTFELVDPELRDALALWPQLPLTAKSLTQRRADLLKVRGAVLQPDLPDITASEIRVESAFGAKPIRILTYRPVKSDNPLPSIVHIHGGGFVMGAPEMKDVENRLLASELGCAIYSVDHRLAPEAPHPAPLEDIYSAFAWLHANARQLGLDPARIGIKGESGGGGVGLAGRVRQYGACRAVRGRGRLWVNACVRFPGCQASSQRRESTMFGQLEGDSRDVFRSFCARPLQHRSTFVVD